MLSLGLSLLGIGKNVMGWLTAGFKWIFASGERIAIALALSLCLWLYVGKSSALASAAKWKRTAEVEMSLRIANEVAYKDAQKVAAEMNRKQIESIQNRYKEIAEQSEKAYEKRLTDSRAVVDKFVRTQANFSPAKSAGTGSATQVQPEATGAGEMPVVPEGFILLPVNEAYMIAGAYDKLAALQDAARAIEKSGNTTSANHD